MKTSVRGVEILKAFKAERISWRDSRTEELDRDALIALTNVLALQYKHHVVKRFNCIGKVSLPNVLCFLHDEDPPLQDEQSSESAA